MGRTARCAGLFDREHGAGYAGEMNATDFVNLLQGASETATVHIENLRNEDSPLPIGTPRVASNLELREGCRTPPVIVVPATNGPTMTTAGLIESLNQLIRQAKRRLKTAEVCLNDGQGGLLPLQKVRRQGGKIMLAAA